MAGELLLINPKKRRRRANPRKSRARSAAARKGWRMRKRNPGLSRRRRNSWPNNPRGHSRAARKGWRVRRRHNPIARRHRRRNPLSFKSMMRTQLMPSLTGAAGALAIDYAMGYLPLPAMMKSGLTGHATKAGLAIGLGWLLDNFKLVKSSTAASFTLGALTVVMYNLSKSLIDQYAPAMAPPSMEGLGVYENPNMGYYSPGYTGITDQSGMGVYYDVGMDGLSQYDQQEYEFGM